MPAGIQPITGSLGGSLAYVSTWKENDRFRKEKMNPNSDKSYARPLRRDDKYPAFALDG